MRNTNLINTNSRTHLQPQPDTRSMRHQRAQDQGTPGRRSQWSAAAATPQAVQPPWERILLIHQAVEARSYPNASTLASDLGISVSTASRDLDYMRHRLHLPLQYDSVRHGYYYVHPVPPGAVHAVSEVDLFGLLVVIKVMSQYRSTPLESALRALFQKVLLFLDPLEFHLLPDLRAALSVPAPAREPEILENLATAGFSV